MAGSPKKRARKKARELAEQQNGTGALPQPAPGTSAAPPEAPAAVADGGPRAASLAPGLPAPLAGEVLPPAPAGDVDPTRTALKRALRQKALAFADEAIERLAAAMRNEDDRIGVPAANALLDRAHGKPTADIDLGDGTGGLLVTIMKFGGTPP